MQIVLSILQMSFLLHSQIWVCEPIQMHYQQSTISFRITILVLLVYQCFKIACLTLCYMFQNIIDYLQY